MKRKERNNQLYLVDVVGEKEPRLVYGKGRNSVSQKVFGIRAHPAIKNGLAKSICKSMEDLNEKQLHTRGKRSRPHS